MLRVDKTVNCVILDKTTNSVMSTTNYAMRGEKMKNMSMEQMTMDADDISGFLGISKQGAYNLLHSVGFPAFRVGKRLLVHRNDFERWLEQQREKGA